MFCIREKILGVITIQQNDKPTQMWWDHTWRWGDHMIAIPYRVWGDHKSHIRHEDTSNVGDHIYMSGTIQYLFHIW